MEPILFPTNSQFWFETLRPLGQVAYGGADAGEVIVTAQRITPGDYDSWYTEWKRTADQIASEAEEQLQAGHTISARDGFLRASNYYRSAEFFLHGNPDDPRINSTYKRSVDCYQKAIAFITPRIEIVTIPYENTILHGYFHHAAGEGAHPTIMMHNGFDGSDEELHFDAAAAAVERGYNVIAFDGPGQPAARHLEGLFFRPDWEHVITPVFDWLLTRPEVDPKRIALLGRSMGGELAPRAAAFEHRLAACIAVDGVYDMGAMSTENYPGTREEVKQALSAESAPEIDKMLEQLMAHNPTQRWAMTHGCYVLGTKSPREFAARYMDYNLLDGIAEQIQCPTLVCEAGEDLFFAKSSQPQQLYDHLTCPKKLLSFPINEGSGAHCHCGATRISNARIYDWLDDILQPAQATK